MKNRLKFRAYYVSICSTAKYLVPINLPWFYIFASQKMRFNAAFEFAKDRAPENSILTSLTTRKS